MLSFIATENVQFVTVAKNTTKMYMHTNMQTDSYCQKSAILKTFCDFLKLAGKFNTLQADFEEYISRVQNVTMFSMFSKNSVF